MIDPKLVESAAKALGDARDRLLALLPEPDEYDCDTCKYEGLSIVDAPCNTCSCGPMPSNWASKEPEPEKPRIGVDIGKPGGDVTAITSVCHACGTVLDVRYEMPTQGKEPKPSWDEVPEFGDEVEFRGKKYIVLWVHYAWVLLGDLDHMTLDPYEFGADTNCCTVTRKAEIRVGDFVESRKTGKRGYAYLQLRRWGIARWRYEESDLARADLILVARGGQNA